MFWGQPILQFTLLDFALLYLWSFVLRGLQSNASNIFRTRMHATHFCHHGARRFESQSNASTILCSRWLPNGTPSGRGDVQRAVSRRFLPAWAHGGWCARPCPRFTSRLRDTYRAEGKAGGQAGGQAGGKAGSNGNLEAGLPLQSWEQSWGQSWGPSWGQSWEQR